MNPSIEGLDPIVAFVVRRFLEEALKLLGDKVAGVVLFGSQAKGGATPSSDYDVMLLHLGDQKEAEEAAAEASLIVSAELNVGIEPLAASITEFWSGSSYFLERVRKEGLIFYRDGNGSEVKRREAVELLLLSESFVEMARLLADHKMYRGAVDHAYNAAELIVKAMLLWDGYDLPSSHGGIVGEFGRVYVLSGEVNRELGRRLSRALEKRNKARYEARAEVLKDDVEDVLKLAEQFMTFAKAKIGVKKS